MRKREKNVLRLRERCCVRMIYVCICEIVIGFLFLLIYFVIDKIITTKRLKLNQTAWDEYSKNMTYFEKCNCYIEWCTRRKTENNWGFYYFPRL